MKLNLKNIQSVRSIRKIDERLVSYNIEMAEVTGGSFWKAYTSAQIAGIEEFPPVSNIQNLTSTKELMQYYPPINLYNERLRKLAKGLGTTWIRVSGTWATKTYYDFEGVTNGKAPDGYQNILTKEQWIGVLDFVKAVEGKLLLSVSNCAGDHPHGGPLDLTQAKKIFDFSHSYGVNIDAIEFMNEPNMMQMSGAPEGYTSADYVRDQDILNGWVRSNYPECLIVGPCTTGDPSIGSPGEKSFGAGIGNMVDSCTTHDLMDGAKIKLDVFSYHYYNGISERLASIMPEAHWERSQAHTDAYLAVAPACVKKHIALRDQYVPDGQIWVTESGDAAGGGDTWASTYLDVFRTLNELGSTVYDCGVSNSQNIHVYCHSRKDGKFGMVYLIINNSLTDTIVAETSKETECYMLGAKSMSSSIMQLNGKNLTISGMAELPELFSVKQSAGIVSLAPGSCTFLVL